MSDTRLVYSTFPTKEEALLAGRRLLEKRLIACANVLPGIHSLYRWEGTVQSADEVVMLAKTTATCMQAAIDEIKANHPYEIPCIVALPIEGGLPAFVQWVKEQTVDGYQHCKTK